MRAHLAFGSPRALPKPDKLVGRVVVLDIAFAANISNSISFSAITEPFLRGLGARLAAWVDHHDHDQHPAYAADERFVLATKAEHGACPEMVTPELVRRVGPVDTILCHLDLDGLYAAAKWLRDGHEPYPGADADAVCVDTRVGQPSAVAARIDKALRVRFRDAELKRAIVHWLVDGRPAGAAADLVAEAAAEFDQRAQGTAALAQRYKVAGRIAFVDCASAKGNFDKTDLLMLGQELAPVAMVLDSGTLTVAAPFNSGWDFVALFELGGGMPTRVSVPESRVADVRRRIDAAPMPSPRERRGRDTSED